VNVNYDAKIMAQKPPFQEARDKKIGNHPSLGLRERILREYFYD